MKHLIFSFSLGLLLCTNNSFAQAQVQTYWDAEQTKSREIYTYIIVEKDTIKNGLYQIYHENGKLWQEGQFTNNQLTGKWVDNHPNGQLKQDLFFANNLLEGEIKSYYPSGALNQIALYKNDYLHGNILIYNENGHYQTQLYRLIQGWVWRSEYRRLLP